MLGRLRLGPEKLRGRRYPEAPHPFRIVDHLEHRYARFDGLNLTFEVREGIVKHSRELEGDADPEVQDLFPGKRPALEAQLIDLADEIAYNTADVDDAFSTGLFSMEQIGESIPVFAELSETAETQFPGAPEHIRFWEIQRHLINVLVGGLVEGTAEAAAQAGVQSVRDVR